jgi:hypothetical protein
MELVEPSFRDWRDLSYKALTNSREKRKFLGLRQVGLS